MSISPTMKPTSQPSASPAPPGEEGECSGITLKKTCNGTKSCRWLKLSGKCAFEATPAPTKDLKQGCGRHNKKKNCRGTRGCRWSRKKGCEDAGKDQPTAAPKACNEVIERRACMGRTTCAWRKKQCRDVAVREPTECADTDPQFVCEDFANNGLCNSEVFRDLLADTCRKSCNLCLEDNYTEKPGYRFSGRARSAMTRATINDCTDRCHVRSWCKSFDYNLVLKECRFFDVAEDCRGDYILGISEDWDHYEAANACE